jgi:hypothetical protein
MGSLYIKMAWNAHRLLGNPQLLLWGVKDEVLYEMFKV